jgi:dipeptidyl aminopeptidase/acylaminoacyl peptidase
MARLSSRTYQFPGDVLDVPRLRVFFVDNKLPVKVDLSLNPAPWWLGALGSPIWSEDSRDFVIRYQERGEQRASAVVIDASSGKARTIVAEVAETFVDRYNAMLEYASTTGELIWSSERDGWRHLYLYDAKTGELKNQITRGEWVVRGIDHVDEKARQVFFRASGRNPGEDPYLIKGYRIDFDGTGLVDLTPEPGNHGLFFSPDYTYFVDSCSRIDDPPTSVLKRAQDGRIVMKLEHADISELLKTAWKLPEPFVSKGRDGKTDIYGVIYRPTNFDPARSYPIIEAIYAGPHSSYVPKEFRPDNWGHALTELGFIVVQIDGMGTANRSKSFHDVCWKNIADAGFADRILWNRAAAKKYPYMDIERVGIYGFSAGGQNATGALLFHPDFYKVAVSSCGCHDNRMDKAVWNEQWMGYPVGPHYEEQSNVTNAYKLTGKLLLLLGELDMNVPPESTLRLADALIKAGKDFELVVLPGLGHTEGGTYGERRRRDFFVRHFLGMEPPDWNRLGEKK